MNSRPITDAEMTDLIGSATTAYRWEHQPVYIEPGEPELMKQWIDGAGVVPPMDHPWVQMVQDMTTRGGELVRVRVQDDPPVPYQQWIAWVAEQWNVPAGEQIRTMSRARANLVGPFLSARRQDWWLLDGRHLIVLTFDRGHQRVATELVKGGAAVLRARAGWDLAVHLSTPTEPRPGVLTTT
jgi:hypothetical protein